MITLGALAATAKTTKITGGWETLSAAKSGNVNLLNVLVTAASGTGHASAGRAYGSKVTAPVGSLHGMKGGPTAPVTVFPPGTQGQTVTNSLAAILLGPGLTLGAITDSGLGMNSTSEATTNTMSNVSAVNLFNGAIKAASISVDASASSNLGISGAAG